jgi:hypothetical protein
MPITFHVNKGAKTRDSQTAVEGQRYATDPNATGEIGTGNFTNRQKDALGVYQARALMRYADVDAYFCNACWYVFGVECPRCHAASEPAHNRPVVVGHDDPLFEVPTYPIYDRYQGNIWVVTTCRKCSFGFRVIKR